MSSLYLTDFTSIEPSYTVAQTDFLSHLATLHPPAIAERIHHVCCKPEKIGRRTFALDFFQTPWKEMDFGMRGKKYAAYVDGTFERFYPLKSPPPEDLIHITCTGYNSPSAPQKLVTKRSWERQTTVTHAYHMGCMGAIPALRMASGFAASGKKTIDLVHTELCSLHFNPTLTADDQLVAQSLFSDGLIKYTMRPDRGEYRLLTTYEELIPNTEHLMTWECRHWGMQMTLSKEIPFHLSRAIDRFVETLAERCEKPLEKAHYAIHPGGPKIVELMQKKLKLNGEQIAATKEILHTRGNLSSATLPHIWEKLLPITKRGELIVGLAFGPGLAMCGVILERT